MAETIVLKSKGFDLKSRKDSMDARGSRPRGLCHGGEELVCSATPQARLGTGATWVAWQEVSVWDQTDLEGPGKAKAASSGSRESGAKAPVGTCYLLCLCRDPWELCSSVQGDGGRGGATGSVLSGLDLSVSNRRNTQPGSAHAIQLPMWAIPSGPEGPW